MRNTERTVYLLRRHIEGKLTIEEQQELDRWTVEDPVYRQLLEDVSNQNLLFEQLSEFEGAYGESQELSMRRTQQMIDAQISQSTVVKKTPIRLTKWLPYVAALVLCIGVAFIVWNNRSVSERDLYSQAIMDKAPGSQKAVLTLADGRKVNLKEDQGYIQLQDGNVQYSDGTAVFDGQLTDLGVNELRYMSISVPNGGTYQVVLSDGTQIWLNAASTLRYPERFVDVDRVVELDGEAYFDVKEFQIEGKKSRFIVKSGHQEIEVLGTAFNVSAYKNQNEIVTTLVEGSVSVSPSFNIREEKILLKPGDQSTVSHKDVSVKKVSVDQYTAWRDGLFYFRNTSFEDMMVQVSRWYDVEIIYKNRVPKETFSGKLSRELSLMTLLELLNVSNVNISLEGKTLIVN